MCFWSLVGATMECSTQVWNHLSGKHHLTNYCLWAGEREQLCVLSHRHRWAHWETHCDVWIIRIQASDCLMVNSPCSKHLWTSMNNGKRWEQHTFTVNKTVNSFDLCHMIKKSHKMMCDRNMPQVINMSANQFKTMLTPSATFIKI